MYRKNKQQSSKVDILLKQERRLFHTNDLALLWGITNSNTLYTTIKRYKKRGILIPVQKGLYSTFPLDQLNPVEVGVAFLHEFAYLSTESVLARTGIIVQSIPAITLVSGTSRKFTIGSQEYRSRQMREDFLRHHTGLSKQNGYYQANTERAVADLLYYNPNYYFDNPDAVDWKKVEKIQKEVGFI